MPDASRTNCAFCSKGFNMTRRRHHCRSCGGLFCATCCPPLGYELSKVALRVCEECFSNSIRGKIYGLLEKKSSKAKGKYDVKKAKSDGFSLRLVELDDPGMNMHYYKVDEPKKERGAIELTENVTVREVTEEESQYCDPERCFVIETQTKVFIWRAVSGDHKLIWMKRLASKIDPSEDLSQSLEVSEKKKKRQAKKNQGSVTHITMVAGQDQQAEQPQAQAGVPVNAVGVPVNAEQPSGTNVQEDESLFEGTIVDAVKEGRMDVVKQMVEKDAAVVETPDEHGGTALLWAARDGNYDLVKFLVDAKADVTIRNKYNKTALLYAARSANLEAVQVLLEAKADAHYNNGSESPLIIAAKEGLTQVVEFLIGLGVDVDGKDQHGGTPLLWAARGEHVDAVTLLLASRANVLAENNYGKSALSYAQRTNNEELIKLLTAASESYNGDGDHYGTFVINDSESL